MSLLDEIRALTTEREGLVGRIKEIDAQLAEVRSLIGSTIVTSAPTQAERRGSFASVQERRQQIVNILQQGPMGYSAICKHFQDVSSHTTVQNDLIALMRDGKIARTTRGYEIAPTPEVVPAAS
jgi:hypothetical protein